MTQTTRHTERAYKDRLRAKYGSRYMIEFYRRRNLAQWLDPCIMHVYEYIIHRSNMELSPITPIHKPRRTGHVSAMTPYQIECAQRKAMARGDAQTPDQPALDLKPSYQPLVDEMRERMRRLSDGR